jgi:hypothetical protein
LACSHMIRNPKTQRLVRRYGTLRRPRLTRRTRVFGGDEFDLALASLGGMRRAEAARKRVEHLDLDGGNVLVPISERGDGVALHPRPRAGACDRGVQSPLGLVNYTTRPLPLPPLPFTKVPNPKTFQQVRGTFGVDMGPRWVDTDIRLV